jgi:hypothetical protein
VSLYFLDEYTGTDLIQLRNGHLGKIKTTKNSLNSISAIKNLIVYIYFFVVVYQPIMIRNPIFGKENSFSK